MRKTLTDKGVAALKPRGKSYPYPDPQLVGHYVRVQPSGSKSFVVVARDLNRKQIWHTVGSADVLRIEEARELARDAIKRIKAGLPAVEPRPIKPDTFQDVAENWLKRHVAVKQLRSEYEIRRSLGKYVYPKWAERDFVAIKRSDVAALLDQIEDGHGSRMADLVLATIRSIANWYASRDDHYVSPFVRGMRRHNNAARDRILTDDELRVIWKRADSNTRFGAIIRLCLLTAQRRDKIASLQWSDLDATGVWTVRQDAREKGTVGSVALPKIALDIIEQQPRLGDNPHVFPGRGNTCFASFSRAKAQFDATLPKMPHWTVHDLRRSARSLLSRCGVAHDIAERVLGHEVGTPVSQIYDRHRYDAEKKAALAKLAQLIERIINGTLAKVVPIRKGERSHV
jgi:integrase